MVAGAVGARCVFVKRKQSLCRFYGAVLYYCTRHPSIGLMATVEEGKRAAGRAAVDTYVEDGMAVGVGSGSTIVYTIERLVEKCTTERLDLTFVPTSFQSLQLLNQYKLPVTDLARCPELDVVIDGADEVDSNLNLIKGGGACQLQEKIVASCGKKLVIVADFRKESVLLGEKWKEGVPIEVLPMAYVPAQKKIETQLGGSAVLRMAVRKAGPVITDNGNFILDWKFDETVVRDWNAVNTQIKLIPGVIETGLFCNMADVVYFGMQDGTVKSKLRQT